MPGLSRPTTDCPTRQTGLLFKTWRSRSRRSVKPERRPGYVGPVRIRPAGAPVRLLPTLLQRPLRCNGRNRRGHLPALCCVCPAGDHGHGAGVFVSAASSPAFVRNKWNGIAPAGICSGGGVWIRDPGERTVGFVLPGLVLGIFHWLDHRRERSNAFLRRSTSSSFSSSPCRGFSA